MKTFVLVLLAACGVGETTQSDGGTTAGGHITADTTWSGTQQVLEATTIDPGVTVTVTAGATIEVKGGVAITVAGTLAIHGATGSVVTISPAAGTTSFGGITVKGGVLDMTYGVVSGATILTSGTGVVTIRDSKLSHAPGDLLVMNGGMVDVQYSAIGVEPPSLDTTHCDLHFGGTGGNTITVMHSNVSTSAYGVMFYAGQSANFTYDNWFSNQTNVDSQPGVNGDFSNGFFQGAPPSGVGITAANLASGRLAACTGGNDAACAGPHP